MKFYDVTFQIHQIGTKVERLSERQLSEAIAAWNRKASVRVPTVGLVRGRSITEIKYDEVIEETPEPMEIEPREPDHRFLVFTDTNDEEVGRLSWDSGTLVFEGNADESAEVFFEVLKGRFENG